MERVDVAVVGARLAGCAVAAPLARAGRRVLVLDKMGFPSDQLSTHVLLPGGTSELAKMGALQRVLTVNPSLVRWVQVEAEGSRCRERLRPADDGIDYGVCVPRDLQDVQLVEAVREQGANVREHCSVESVRWRTGRAAGVTYRDAGGVSHEVEATLVVGADGRRSTVASLVGAWTPYRVSRNGRGLVFRYLDDPLVGTIHAETYYQWREGDSIAFAFPTAPVGKLLVLLMGHRDEVRDARKDPEGYWLRKLGEHPGLAERVAGASPGSKLRSTGETPAFFRASSGPGWALAGDAGHFKDPVTGQGMRDAMWMGRTLAEHVLPALDDPFAVDLATRAWEAERDRECLPAYHFANADTRAERQSPALCELIRDAGRTTAPDLGDLFGRARTPQEIAPLPRLARALGAALWRGERPRSESLSRGLAELRGELEIRLERRADRFRSTRLVSGSDHPGASWPAPPAMRREPTGAPAPEPFDPRRGGRSMTRIAVVQPALALGEVERNLARIEDLIRDAHREHGADVIVVPEACTSPNVYAKVLRGAPRPVDGQPFQLLTRLARELDCVVAGGFLAVRGGHSYGTFVLAEPDGAVHLHDKDIPTAWEQNFYVGGDDDGVVRCAALDATVGLMSGWEWARHRTAGRVRTAGAQLVLGGMCWPSMPLNWPGPLSWWAQREHAIWRRQARELPGQVARLTGVPVAHASHVGPVAGETPLGPGIPWRTQMIGESQVCDRDGTVLARLSLEDGEGHVAADIEIGPARPLDTVLERFWIPDMTLTTHVAWHAMNAHGALAYRARHALRGFPWQAWPAGDLPDELPASPASDTPATTSS